MKTKTSGAEIKAFWNLCEPWWPKEGFVDGDSYTVNGESKDDSFDPSCCDDNDNITILSGCICDQEKRHEEKDLQSVFRKWRKSLKVRSVLVEIDAESVDYLKEEVKKLGGKIIS